MRSSLAFLEQFEQIELLLSNTRQYWQISPFELLKFPWNNDPKLCDFLAQLSDDEIESLDRDDQALRHAMSPFFSLSLDVLAPLSLNEESLAHIPAWFNAGIKGRKWAQIEKFAAQIPSKPTPILEWCAGKGHLGRALSFSQQREVVSVEWQHNLCEQGTVLAEKHCVQQQFIQADVFIPTDHSLLTDGQHAIALHACGDLHIELLKQATRAGTSSITIAPCCYHLVRADRYQPLSAAAKRSLLQLNKHDLSLSMAQTVVATQRVRTYRRVEVAWRLGFDLLQRKLRCCDEYLPLPSIKQSMLAGEFIDFCRWACQVKSLVLPDDFNIQPYEQLGWQRRKINARIELVTHAFRAILERWLLLDRVLFLSEQGYQVELSEFCDHKITPRNALITAYRK